MFKNLLRIKELNNWTYTYDDPETTNILHRKIIMGKPFLYQLYKDWYQIFNSYVNTLPRGTLLEIGSGAGFIKEIIPDILVSDVLTLSNLNFILSAEKLPFKSESLSGIFLIDVFHHIPKPAEFLREAQRCLKENGKVIMIEPDNTAWSRFIYVNFHREPFNILGGWEISYGGPLSGSNMALPWIFFERDKNRFLEEFPLLKIEQIFHHTPLQYLLSGGFSIKCLVPSWSYKFFRVLDKYLNLISNQLSMFQTIILVKSSENKR